MPSGLLKVSGDGFKDKRFLKYAKEFSKKYFATTIVGGGSAISIAFEEAGYKSDNFCLVGRQPQSLPEKQLMRDILEEQQASCQDLFNREKIGSRVIIPWREAASVSCPENGDVTILSLYIGFDKIVIFTRYDNVEAKKQWLKKLALCFKHINPGRFDKIEVRGF